MSGRTLTANIRPGDDRAIVEAAEALRAGLMVAFPTETVYGLGADATNEAAVARVFEAKARPRFNPLIVHFADADAAAGEVLFDERARALASAFWPGPLTLVLPRARTCRIARLTSAGLDSVAVRVPGHVIAQKLLSAAAMPVAGPSANRFGDLSPTAAAHVAFSLGLAPAMILDGGPTRIGIESTVLDLTGPQAALLRPGGVPAEAVEAAIGPLSYPAEDPDGVARKSPGRTPRHYAPRTPLRAEATEVRPREALLAFGASLPPGAERAVRIFNLSPGADTTEAAANLFAMLHELDAAGAAGIAAMPVPDNGLGAAINDRLRRAAEPLPDRPLSGDPAQD